MTKDLHTVPRLADRFVPWPEKRFGNFLAEMGYNEERFAGDDSSYCHITHVPSGECNSLAMIEDFGYIDPDDGDTIPVPDSIVERVRAWAENYGY